MSPPRDKTACQTSPCKCKICISSIKSDVYNKKKIQKFVVNMTFILSREVKKCLFHLCLRHSWNIHFFTSLDEIKVIFTPNIWISSIYFSPKNTNNKTWHFRGHLAWTVKAYLPGKNISNSKCCLLKFLDSMLGVKLCLIEDFVLNIEIVDWDCCCVLFNVLGAKNRWLR